MLKMAMRLIGAAMLLTAAACGKKDSANTTTQAQAAVVVGTPTRDWSRVIVATPEGGFRMGNPTAKVRFVEYASLTCPHCKDFHIESDAELTKFVADGRVSYEYRNYVLNAPDLVVTLLARCQTPAGFFKVEDALYRTQETWFGGLVSQQDKVTTIQSAPPADQPLLWARGMKMDDFFKLRGMNDARLNACLNDKAGQQRLNSMMQVADTKYQVTGTPTFFINDALVTANAAEKWPEVKAAIQAAL